MYCRPKTTLILAPPPLTLFMGFRGFLYIFSLSCGMEFATAATALNNTNIVDAVRLWFDDRTAAVRQFGHISDWETWRVTKIKELFCERGNVGPGLKECDHQMLDSGSFNEDVSRWDTARVTSMLRSACIIFCFLSTSALIILEGSRRSLILLGCCQHFDLHALSMRTFRAGMFPKLMT